AEDGIRDFHVTGVQTCALPIHAQGAARLAAGPDAHARANHRAEGALALSLGVDSCGARAQTHDLEPNEASGEQSMAEGLNRVMRSEERRVGKEDRSRREPGREK